MIDSHCHLNFNELVENFHNIINNSKLNNITSILSINTDPKDFEEHLDLIKNYNSIYLSYGLHPDKVDTFNQIQLQNFDIACKNEGCLSLPWFWFLRNFKKSNRTLR